MNRGAGTSGVSIITAVSTGSSVRIAATQYAAPETRHRSRALYMPPDQPRSPRHRALRRWLPRLSQTSLPRRPHRNRRSDVSRAVGAIKSSRHAPRAVRCARCLSACDSAVNGLNVPRAATARGACLLQFHHWHARDILDKWAELLRMEFARLRSRERGIANVECQ